MQNVLKLLNDNKQGRGSYMLGFFFLTTKHLSGKFLLQNATQSQVNSFKMLLLKIEKKYLRKSFSKKGYDVSPTFARQCA